MNRVLVVEDEAHLAEGLRFNLQAEGYGVEVAADGESALKRLQDAAGRFDAVVLDVMLPGINGFDVVSTLRKAKNFIPVLILTARGRPEDVLEGFGAGADDYLPKPFELPIFLARLQGLLRRNEWLRSSSAPAAQRRANGKLEGAAGAASNAASGSAVGATANTASSTSSEAETISFEGKTIDFGTLELRTERNTIQLTLMEAKLLQHLIRNKGRNVSRKSILEDVWGLSEDTDTRAIDNFIVRLRRYIEKNPAKPRHLLTVRGVGYRFVA
jgi:DNA-binding response OmpR family regulator